MAVTKADVGVAGHRLTLTFNYVLMFLATFTLGLLAPIAAIVAYSRRGSAAPIERSHYDQQIKNFWQDILLILVGAVCGWLAIAGGIGTVLGFGGTKLPGGMSVVQTGWATIAFAVIWGVLWVWGFFNLIVESALGLIRLASGRPAGKTRPGRIEA